ncbi:hypothetical protein JZU68_04895 [bacterium]|nr:hypothetical protein [bacterium]
MKNTSFTSFSNYLLVSIVSFFTIFNVVGQQPSDKAFAKVADVTEYGMLDVTLPPYNADPLLMHVPKKKRVFFRVAITR